MALLFPQGVPISMLSRYGSRAWLRMLRGAPKSDLEEVRRGAAQNWRAEFGPKRED
jgi:hypothetical protein